MLTEEIMKKAAAFPPCGSLYKKIHSSEPLTVMFLGGSITAGSVECGGAYPERVCEMLRKDFPQREIRCVNLGEATFSSSLGLLTFVRFSEEIKPDIVFAEFAVNDGFDRYNADNFESLIRRIVSEDYHPAAAVICCCRKDGYTCEEFMREIADSCGVPSVSLRTALEGIDFDEYSDDGLHPNDKGQEMLAELAHYLLMNAPDGEDVMPPEPLCYGNSTQYIQFFNRNNLEVSPGGFKAFDNERYRSAGWRYEGDGEGMRFLVPKETCKGIMCVMHIIGRDQRLCGRIDIVVNGTVHAVLDSYSIYAWDNPVCFGVYLHKGIDNHVEIRMHEGDEKKHFELLGLGM
ncbi:MAG: SGNH/GDSL hydrolase family protein [Huintestinicola sp.]